MLILLGTVLALLLVPVLGGSLRPLADLRLRSGWLVGLALLLQVIAITVVPTWPRPPLVAMHLLSYVLAALFVWLNRALPGIAVLSVGSLCNAVTIGLNGGTLPASERALRAAGVPVDPHRFVNSGVLVHPHLAVLGDNYASPSWLPLHNVYSIGDMLILAGAVWLVHRTCGTVLGQDPRAGYREYRALTSVRMEDHLDVLDELDQARYDRDVSQEALEAAYAESERLRQRLAGSGTAAGVAGVEPSGVVAHHAIGDC